MPAGSPTARPRAEEGAGSPQQQSEEAAAGGGAGGISLPPNLLGSLMGQQASGGGGHFDWLRQHPQFNQIKAMVQRNPQLLGPLLQQLGQLNPQILQIIGQNQAEFMALLNEPIQGGAAAAGGGPPPGSNYIQVTQEEKEAIDRVKQPIPCGLPQPVSSQLLSSSSSCRLSDLIGASSLKPFLLATRTSRSQPIISLCVLPRLLKTTATSHFLP